MAGGTFKQKTASEAVRIAGLKPPEALTTEGRWLNQKHLAGDRSDGDSGDGSLLLCFHLLPL